MVYWRWDWRKGEWHCQYWRNGGGTMKIEEMGGSFMMAKERDVDRKKYLIWRNLLRFLKKD